MEFSCPGITGPRQTLPNRRIPFTSNSCSLKFVAKTSAPSTRVHDGYLFFFDIRETDMATADFIAVIFTFSTGLGWLLRSLTVRFFPRRNSGPLAYVSSSCWFFTEVQVSWIVSRFEVLPLFGLCLFCLIVSAFTAKVLRVADSVNKMKRDQWIRPEACCPVDGYGIACSLHHIHCQNHIT